MRPSELVRIIELFCVENKFKFNNITIDDTGCRVDFSYKKGKV